MDRAAAVLDDGLVEDLVGEVLADAEDTWLKSPRSPRRRRCRGRPQTGLHEAERLAPQRPRGEVGERLAGGVACAAHDLLEAGAGDDTVGCEAVGLDLAEQQVEVLRDATVRLRRRAARLGVRGRRCRRGGDDVGRPRRRLVHAEEHGGVEGAADRLLESGHGPCPTRRSWCRRAPTRGSGRSRRSPRC
jgi:hypothetical protein